MACAFQANRRSVNAFRLTGELNSNGAETCEIGQIAISPGNTCAFEMPFSLENSSIWTSASEKMSYSGQEGDYSTAVEFCAAQGGYIPMIRTQSELDEIIGKDIKIE